MDAFFVEAKWLRSGELVKAEKYLKNGVISTGVPMVLAHLFFLMGNPLTNQTQSLLNDPQGLTHSVAKLLRLLDRRQSSSTSGEQRLSLSSCISSRQRQQQQKPATAASSLISLSACFSDRIPQQPPSLSSISPLVTVKRRRLPQSLSRLSQHKSPISPNGDYSNDKPPLRLPRTLMDNDCQASVVLSGHVLSKAPTNPGQSISLSDHGRQ